MFKNKLIIIAMFMLVLSSIYACNLTDDYYIDRQGKQIQITNPLEQCAIYKYVKGDAGIYRFGLFAANYAAIKQGVYTPQECIAELNTLKTEVQKPGSTVGSFVTAIFNSAGRLSRIGAPELIVIVRGLGAYTTDTTPLDDCSVYVLIKLIDSQIAIAQSLDSGISPISAGVGLK